MMLPIFPPMTKSSSAVPEQHMVECSTLLYYTLGQKSSMFLSVVTISTITHTLSFQVEMYDNLSFVSHCVKSAVHPHFWRCGTLYDNDDDGDVRVWYWQHGI